MSLPIGSISFGPGNVSQERLDKWAKEVVGLMDKKYLDKEKCLSFVKSILEHREEVGPDCQCHLCKVAELANGIGLEL